jgi:hypothetical protein
MPRNAVVVRRSLAPLAVALLATGLAACGGGPNSPDTPTTVTTTLPTQPFRNLAPGEVVFAEVTMNGAGVLTGTADWSSPSNDIDIYVTAPSCRAVDIFELANCQALGLTTSVTAKPERLTVTLSQGNHRVWVANFGPGTETGTLQLTATVTQ